MRSTILPVTLILMFAASCGKLTTEHTSVVGTGPDELLKLRAGPGLGYRVTLGLPEGTVLNRLDCVTEIGWCRVSLKAAPQITGYVSADYLSVH